MVPRSPSGWPPPPTLPASPPYMPTAGGATTEASTPTPTWTVPSSPTGTRNGSAGCSSSLAGGSPTWPWPPAVWWASPTSGLATVRGERCSTTSTCPTTTSERGWAPGSWPPRRPRHWNRTQSGSVPLGPREERRCPGLLSLPRRRLRGSTPRQSTDGEAGVPGGRGVGHQGRLAGPSQVGDRGRLTDGRPDARRRAHPRRSWARHRQLRLVGGGP